MPSKLQSTAILVVTVFWTWMSSATMIVFPSQLNADENNAPDSLEAAKTEGRTHSRLLRSSIESADPQTQSDDADLTTFQASIGPLLDSKCKSCHGADVEEGNLRVDTLDPNLLTGSSLPQWREVYKVVANGEMPPADDTATPLSDEDRQITVEWLSRELTKASVAERNQSQHTSFRRLTRREYEYAMEDLLHPPYPLGSRLPPETASHQGFLNSSDMLQMSALQFETYRELGLEGLRRVIAVGEQPTPVIYNIQMSEHWDRLHASKPEQAFSKDDQDFKNQSRRIHLFNRADGAGLPFSHHGAQPDPNLTSADSPDLSPIVLSMSGSSELKWNLDRFLPDEGIMRVRLRVGRTTQDPDEFIALRLIFSAHTSNNANFSEVISDHDIPITAPADAPEYIHFDIPLSQIQRNPFRKLETTFPRRDEFLHLKCVTSGKRPETPVAIHIDHMQIIAPYFAQWPPETHRAIFIESPNRSNPNQYAQEILEHFVTRAWRRSLDQEELDELQSLFKIYRGQVESFEEAIIEVLATALASPEFLYLTQLPAAGDSREGSTISPYTLASRLSFFLWSSIPDEELLTLAHTGELSEPAVLRAQVERMLADPKTQRFENNFVHQWLGLAGLDSINHVKDPELLASMRQEPVAFFRHQLEQNGSVIDFLHTDGVWVNERLARHYGLPNVYGPEFRRVTATQTGRRGGVLTSAAVMAMNATEQDSNPLKRGVWMLERILNDPPPPPPPDVPQVDLTDPRILEMTLKERIEDHRNHAACRSCHSRIDPWGIAFENYDAQGAFRTAIAGQPVDATSILFNRQPLDGIEGLKRYLLIERQDQFVRSFVHKLTTYALGRPLQFSDHAEIDRIASDLRQSGDGLRDLVMLICESPLFNTRVEVHVDER
jgi:hypothetical protein